MNEEEEKKIVELRKKLIPLVTEYETQMFTAVSYGIILVLAQLNGMSKEAFMLYTNLAWERTKQETDKTIVAEALINSVMKKDGT